MVSNPIVVNKNKMSAEDITKMRSILKNMANDKAGLDALKTVKIAAFPELSDKGFDPLRKILAKKAELKKKK